MEKQREHLWDNLKAILILLVVIGHCVDQYIDSQIFKGIYVFIYAFHMPLFIFVSGIFHKNKNIGNKILAYIIIGYLYKVIFFLTKIFCGNSASISIFIEKSTPWYMFALAMFIGVTYLFRHVNAKLVLLGSVLLGVIAGYDVSIGDYLILSRFFVFYPFYYLGTMVDRKSIEEFTKKKHIKIFAIILIAFWAILCIFNTDLVYFLRGFFTGRNPYKGRVAQIGGMIRLFQYALGVTLSLAFISVVPRVKYSKITEIGTKTLQIYFWHRIILYVLKEVGIVDRLCITQSGKVIYLIIGTIMVPLLSCKIFAFPTEFIIRLSKEENGVDGDASKEE